MWGAGHSQSSNHLRAFIAVREARHLMTGIREMSNEVSPYVSARAGDKDMSFSH